METADLINRLLDVIEHDIAPRTREGVRRGNKLFGAAILRKSDLSVVVAETNNEIENPLWHGEMHAIKRFFERPAAERPEPSECLFLTTHEPCSLCLSGITWSGFDNFYYLFSHEDSRNSFAIPHDIEILREVYAVPDPDRNEVPADRPLYNRSNRFWQSHDLAAMAAGLNLAAREAVVARLDNFNGLYTELSAAYQKNKGQHNIPSPEPGHVVRSRKWANHCRSHAFRP